MAFPILFIPFVSRASEVIGRRIKISIDKQIYLLNYNQTIYSNVISETVINNGNLVKLNILENTDSFSDSEWNEIYKMSEDTFVEENEELKKNAAGAGITDND